MCLSHDHVTCVRACACARAIRMPACCDPRARAAVDVVGDVKGPAALSVVPRVGAGQPRRHKSRGAGLAFHRVGPACRVAFRLARGVEEGGGQEREGDQAEIRLDGQDLLGRLSTCTQWGCVLRGCRRASTFLGHLHMWRMCACECARCGGAPLITKPPARSSSASMQFTSSHRVSAFVFSFC